MRILAGAALMCVSASAGAQSGGFITQLGKDTIAVERFVRTSDSIVGEMITRSPTTARYSYVAPEALSFAWDTRVGRIGVALP
jgi:hypothetical protein